MTMTRDIELRVAGVGADADAGVFEHSRVSALRCVRFGFDVTLLLNALQTEVSRGNTAAPRGNFSRGSREASDILKRHNKQLNGCPVPA